MSNPKTPRLLKALFALDRDERGTTMTEFVITLPVFITLFAGIGTLTRMEKESVRTKLMAARETWNTAFEVYDSRNSPFPSLEHSTYQVGGALAIAETASHTSGMADIAELDKNRELISDGHVGEGRGISRWAKNARFFSGNLPSEPQYGKTAFDSKLVHDGSAFSPLGFPEGDLYMFIPASIYAGGSWHAMAAGTRYGMAAGSAQRSGSIGRYNYDYENGYDVAVSPAGRSKFLGELVTIGYSRIAAQKDRCIGTIFGLDKPRGTTGCRPSSGSNTIR